MGSHDRTREMDRICKRNERSPRPVHGTVRCSLTRENGIAKLERGLRLVNLMKISLFFCFVSIFQAQTDLDRFLNQKGYHFTPSGTAVCEGYISPKQKEAFIAKLAGHPGIRKIAEVGFNAGHTSEVFLEYAKDSQVVSFDINAHVYTKTGVEFIQSKYKDRFQFVAGDSRFTVLDYFKAHPKDNFDLIYIDGCHLFGACLDDILNFKSLAHKDSVLWIDDAHFPDVQRAVDFAERLQIIEVVASESAEDEFGVRAWVEGRYLFRN